MAVKSRKKDAYWHSIAKVCLSHGMKPAQVGKIIKDIFPETEINGRHIGAYKRRLITDGMIEKGIKPTISPNEAYGLIEGMVGEDDKFIYQCTVGSAKRSLKCFEYKMTEEVVDHTEIVDTWITQIQA